MSRWPAPRWHARVFLRTIGPHEGPRIISTWWRSYSSTAEPWRPAATSSRSGTRGGDHIAAKSTRVGKRLTPGVRLFQTHRSDRAGYAASRRGLEARARDHHRRVYPGDGRQCRRCEEALAMAGGRFPDVQARPIAGLEGTSLPLDAFPLLLAPCEGACHIQLTVRAHC